MTLPRAVLPGKTYMLNRRCTQRQFLLKPDDKTNQAYLYCLGVAAQRFEIDVILPLAMSNHEHIGLYDRHGHEPEFTTYFHGLLARCMNAHLGRWENFWANEPPCLVECVGVEDVISKLVYIATNPVKAHLVERAHQWPGASGYAALLHGRPITIRRPEWFFRAKGSMPKTITITCEIPPEVGDADEILREVKERVAAVEAQMAAERAATGRRILGRRGVYAQKWWESPTSREPRRGLRPRVAARSTWQRIAALQRNCAFVEAYRDARKRWLGGACVVFPEGTYWLRRFGGVECLAPIPMVN